MFVTDNAGKEFYLRFLLCPFPDITMILDIITLIFYFNTDNSVH